MNKPNLEELKRSINMKEDQLRNLYNSSHQKQVEHAKTKFFSHVLNFDNFYWDPKSNHVAMNISCEHDCDFIAQHAREFGMDTNIRRHPKTAEESLKGKPYEVQIINRNPNENIEGKFGTRRVGRMMGKKFV